MKRIKTATVSGVKLTVLVKEITDTEQVRAAEKSHREGVRIAHVDYFINEHQVIDWGQTLPMYQGVLTALADYLCNDMKLIKWSY